MSRGDSGNLILTGFMGTGKTIVGRAVAQRLGRPFVDMDVEIQARTNKSISHLFSEDGEAAFRRHEADLCQELAEQEGLVIATGGGTLIDASNRVILVRSGTVVCLTCDVDEILKRVTGDDGTVRPLLRVADPRGEIERLLKVRHPAYAAIPWHIETTGLSIPDVVANVITLSRVVTLSVHHPGGQYPIHIGNGLLAHVGGALRAAGAPDAGRVALVSNPVVSPLYGSQLETALRSAGFRPFFCSVPDGERYKTLETVSALYGQFLAGGLDRDGTVVSLGGGVTGDVSGFAAATFMRGVRFVQIPTTLLAMVDASVGGKTGVDLPQGKNLVGAFKQPALVVVDPSVLATLPGAELRAGLAEVIKHGIIGAPDLFTELETGDGVLSSWWNEGAETRLARALQVKIQVVEDDPLEKGRRAVLNLGHTLGHALEQLSSFTLRHGEAVAIGMLAATRIAAELGRADPTIPDQVAATLTAWQLPTRCPPFGIDSIWEAMAHDKKQRGRGLRWVLPNAIGQVEIIEDIPPHVVNAVLHRMGARSEP